MPAAIPAVIGGAAAIGGSLIGANSQKKAAKQAAQAAQWQPVGVSTTSGGVSYDPTRGLISHLNAGEGYLQNDLQSLLSQGIWPTQQRQAQNYLNTLWDQAPLEFAGQQRGVDRYVGDYLSSLGGLRKMGLQGLETGMGMFNQPSVVDPYARSAADAGAGMIGSGVDAYDRTLANLRAGARPMEERAVNQRVQDLFSKGILSSTSGARSLGELALAQEQADIGRQLEAEGVMQNRLRTGQGLLGLGMGSMLEGQGMNARLGSAMSGLFGDAFNRLGGLESARMQAGLSRGATRMGNLANMFGFTTGAANQPLDYLSKILGMSQSIGGAEMDRIKAAGQITQGAAGAGANVAQALLAGGSSNPMASAISGLGSGLFQTGLQNMDFSGFFGGGNSSPAVTSPGMINTSIVDTF